MGAGASKPESEGETEVEPEAAAAAADGVGGDPELGKPYFFVASCPEEKHKEAIALANKYGGFHCLVEDEDDLVTKKESSFAAWKGKVEIQFTMLKRLSPAGRKVIAVAIAGFGPQNDERDFLRKLGKKKGHEELHLKQCGDTEDLERWLKDEGYKPVQVLGLACRPVLSSLFSFGAQPRSATPDAAAIGKGKALGRGGLPPQPKAETSSRMGTVAEAARTMLFGPAATVSAGELALRERLLADAQMAAEASKVDDTSSLSALQKSRGRLSSAISEAQAAGVQEEELQGAQDRLHELDALVEERSSWRNWLCCDVVPYQLRLKAHDDGFSAVDATSTVPPARAVLEVGTKCRYDSVSRSGWIEAVVEGFNDEDNTYNLDVRAHAKLEYISPSGLATMDEAWPPGTLVSFRSGRSTPFAPAMVLSFNEGSDGADGHYNLDIEECVSVDQIRPRVA